MTTTNYPIEESSSEEYIKYVSKTLLWHIAFHKTDLKQVRQLKNKEEVRAFMRDRAMKRIKEGLDTTAF